MSKRRASEDLKSSDKRPKKAHPIRLRVVDVRANKGGVIGKKHKWATFRDWNNHPGNVYCARQVYGVWDSFNSEFSNPYKMDKKAKDEKAERKHVIELFEEHAKKQNLAHKFLEHLLELVKKQPEDNPIREIQLGCWCTPLPCHVHKLIEMMMMQDERAAKHFVLAV